MHGPQVPACDKIHAEKYRGKRESFREAMNRVANAMADDEVHYRAFRDALLNMRFLPGGRIQAAMGSARHVTPYNCFVSGSIEDSFTAGHGSIMGRAAEAAETMRLGGGIGYDFSTLRPRGDLIKKLDSKSSGPISFMGIFDAVCRTVASSGHRRGAQMGVLRVDHPDVEEFVHAKQNSDQLTGFNVSVAVTDAFMRAVESGADFVLRFGSKEYGHIDARALWEMIMRSTWDWAEPGVLFIDQINRMNNLGYCETIAATNPCGEQPLPPYGACLLGSFNLPRYLMYGPNGWGFDAEQLRFDVGAVVRAMDNVVDRATYPLFEQEKEAKAKRRMGLGVTGAANAIESMGPLYGSPEFVAILESVLGTIKLAAYEASVELAREKGPFPLFDADQFLQSGFVQQSLPSHVQEAIAEHGIRNSHLLSIAPTGTISLAADNVSSGIEPVFAYEVDRTIQDFDGPRVVTLRDYGLENFGTRGKVSAEVTVDEHLAVLAAASAQVDSAVSKTCNVPAGTSWEDFKDLYFRAWRHGCKGLTTYQVGGKRAPILEDASCRYDPVTGLKECE